MSVILVTFAFGLVCNLALCHFFPIWGNYIHAGIAAGSGLVTICFFRVVHTLDGAHKDRSGTALLGMMEVLFGLGVTAILGAPVVIKMVVVGITRVFHLLLAFSNM